MIINLIVGPDKNLVNASGDNLIAGSIALSIDFQVERLNRQYLKVFWEYAEYDTDVKWVYVDGILFSGTASIDSEGNEYVTVPVDNSRTAAIEVYSYTTQVDSQEEYPSYLPIINWKPGFNAYRYFVYIDGQLERTMLADASKYLNRWQTVEHLTDGWHYIVVQAKDKAGNAENSLTKWFKVWTPGAPVTDIAVANGSGAGLYDVTIGV